MKTVIQRSLKSTVSVNEQIVGSIDFGLVVLVSFTHNDTVKDIDYMVDKIINLRIFDDENSVMNKSLIDVSGQILSISQFTLYGDTKKGRRPSYVNAMEQNKANEYYQLFNNKLKEKGIVVATGIFRADMIVNITNNGPVTIIIESGEIC